MCTRAQAGISLVPSSKGTRGLPPTMQNVTRLPTGFGVAQIFLAPTPRRLRRCCPPEDGARANTVFSAKGSSSEQKTPETPPSPSRSWIALLAVQNNLPHQLVGLAEKPDPAHQIVGQIRGVQKVTLNRPTPRND